MIKNKRAQGLEFVSILVLLGLMFFILRYNDEQFEFGVAAGAKQAHLVTAFVETEKAKTYEQYSARQSAYEAVWNMSGRSQSCSTFSEICNKELEFRALFDPLFSSYIAIYDPALANINTAFPTHRYVVTCAPNKLTIEGFGFDESCVVQPGFAVPEIPCADQLEEADCRAVRYVDSTLNACDWNIDLQLCLDIIERPDCIAAINEQECSNTRGCMWRRSFSENIDITSAPLADYQFSVESDAHFIEEVTCDEYQAFAATRPKLFTPTCIISVQPESGPIGTFVFKVEYKDDLQPQTLELTVRNTTDEIGKATLNDFQTDANDMTYDDGKLYTYTSNIAKADVHKAAVSCKDTDNNEASDEQEFNVV